MLVILVITSFVIICFTCWIGFYLVLPPEYYNIYYPSLEYALLQCVNVLSLCYLFHAPYWIYHPINQLNQTTTAHEYIKVDGNIGTVGITDFAQSALGDIVFVDLPEVGDDFDKGDSFGSVESVKAASDVYAPVSGTIVEVNENLSDEPGLVNSDAEGDAWFMKIEMKDTSDLEGLLDAAAYKEHCEKE